MAGYNIIMAGRKREWPLSRGQGELHPRLAWAASYYFQFMAEEYSPPGGRSRVAIPPVEGVDPVGSCINEGRVGPH